MSITRALLRMVTVEALRGHTLAGTMVEDSSLTALDHRVTEDSAPVIVVYTDDRTSQPTGRGDELSEVTQELVIEISAAGLVSLPDGAGETVVTPETDGGLELTLDLIEAQVIRRLTASHDAFPTLWKTFVPRIVAVSSRRGASADQTTRYAARQLVLTCELLIDPPPGAPLAETGPWAQALDALALANPGAERVLAAIRAVIEGDPLPDWRREAARMGINLDVADGIGIGPLGTAPDPVPMVDGEGVELDDWPDPSNP